jgi:hypothetical protein
MNKFVQPRPFANSEAAARKLMELAHAFEPIQDGRIYIEAINGPFLFEHKGTPAGPQARHRARLAGAARERDIRAVHGGWIGLIRVSGYWAQMF